MTDHSKYNGPEPQIEPVEVDIGAEFAVESANDLIRRAGAGIAPHFLIAVSIVACGSMIARAICQLDATIRRRG